jgi:hypothetical protein
VNHRGLASDEVHGGGDDHLVDDDERENTRRVRENGRDVQNMVVPDKATCNRADGFNQLLGDALYSGM